MLDDLEDDPERRMAGSIPARPCAIRRAAAAIESQLLVHD